MSTAIELPGWDMTVVYPGLDSPEFREDFDQLARMIDGLSQTFDRVGVHRTETGRVDETVAQAFDGVVRDFNAVLDRYATTEAYIYAFVSTDSRDTLAQARWSEIEQITVRLSQLNVRFTAWVGSLDLDRLQELSSEAGELSYLLARAKVDAEHQMSPAEEDLAAEMDVTGSAAWSRLYTTLSSQLMVDVEFEGERPVPMTVVRNMAFNEDRDVRRAGYEAELGGWESIANSLAAALNSIKGETITLAGRRGWADPLEASLFANSIDRRTLEAMLAAARDAFPDVRRYLRAKARALKLERLAWYDLFAPVGDSQREWGFDESRAFIVDQFGTYSDRLSGLASRAFSDRWIDAGARPGKSGGAFCMPLRGEESRILSNYVPTYDGMSTLAHELGHGYHNMNLASSQALLRGHPMTLAETASTFCQTIVQNAALQSADRQDKISILESALQDHCQLVVDISSRFLFESNVFERRRKRDLSVDELNNLMREAQMETYGDGLDPNVLHPLMWAAKSHYYGSTFYNYPYMFGLLFGLGLYSRYERDPEQFKAGYDEFLASTGRADAATLAMRFDIDTRSREFWETSLDVTRRDVDQFVSLVDQATTDK